MGNTIVQEISCSALEQQNEKRAVGELVYSEEFVLNVERLKKLDVLVLDTTVVDTSVGQYRALSSSDKKKVWNCVKSCGLQHFAISNFHSQRDADDELAVHVNLMGDSLTDRTIYSFAELVEAYSNGVPARSIPASFAKLEKFHFQNIILEIYLLDPFLDWRKFSQQEFFELVSTRLDALRRFATGNIFLYCADAFDTFRNNRTQDRLMAFLAFASSVLAPRFRLTGIMIKDSSGDVLPWEVADITRQLRETMNHNRWTEGHLLVSLHRGLDLATTATLAALSAGATGIFGPVCDGATMFGQVCTTTVTAALSKLGNRMVANTYQRVGGELREAAARVSRLLSGAAVPVHQEVYGPRALVLFQGPGVKFEKLRTFSVESSGSPHGEVTVSLSEEEMSGHLDGTFGPRGYPAEVIERMCELLNADLHARQHHHHYQPKRRRHGQSKSSDADDDAQITLTSLGTLRLYERAGGDQFLDEMAAVVIADPGYLDMDQHALMQQLHGYFMSFVPSDQCPSATMQSLSGDYHVSDESEPDDGEECDDSLSVDSSSSDEEDEHSDSNVAAKNRSSRNLPSLALADDDVRISYRSFFEAFASHYLPHTSCVAFKDLMWVLDVEQTGQISWIQVKQRARWTLAEHSKERDHWTLPEFLHQIMSECVFTELQLSLARQKPLFMQLKASSPLVAKSRDLRRRQSFLQQQQQQHNQSSEQHQLQEATTLSLCASEDSVNLSTDFDYSTFSATVNEDGVVGGDEESSGVTEREETSDSNQGSWHEHAHGPLDGLGQRNPLQEFFAKSRDSSGRASPSPRSLLALGGSKSASHKTTSAATTTLESSNVPADEETDATHSMLDSDSIAAEQQRMKMLSTFSNVATDAKLNRRRSSVTAAQQMAAAAAANGASSPFVPTPQVEAST